MRQAEVILETKSLTKAFGALLAVTKADIEVLEGEFLAIIGPNGAGKTTLFNLISGALKPTSGEILFRGEAVSGLAQYEICQRGISRTFQITQIFPQLTVLENVRLSSQFKTRGKRRILGGKETLRETERKSEEMLRFFNLSDKAGDLAHSLSHGDQRLLELSMALVQEPELVLLDEPTAGLSVDETHQAVEFLKRISLEKEKTIVLVEHDMDVVFNLAHRIVVLNFGQIIAKGDREYIRNHRQVQEAYLGGLE